jgi:hypothetical protein
MKREIACPPCAQNIAKAVTGSRFVDGQIVDPYPGEHARFQSGKLTRHCVCDSCSAELAPGENAVAVSMWADYGGIPYYPWEWEYLEGALRKREAPRG